MRAEELIEMHTHSRSHAGVGCAHSRDSSAGSSGLKECRSLGESPSLEKLSGLEVKTPSTFVSVTCVQELGFRV